MENKEKTEKELAEIAYGKRMLLAKCKNDYISNLTNGRYFLARYNMMAEQIQTGDIKETVDGYIKPMEYMRAEAVVLKRQATAALRAAHFGQLDLKKDFNLIDEDIVAIEDYLYDGKIIRETYDEEYKRGKKAEFVDKQ